MEGGYDTHMFTMDELMLPETVDVNDNTWQGLDVLKLRGSDLTGHSADVPLGNQLNQIFLDKNGELLPVRIHHSDSFSSTDSEGTLTGTETSSTASTPPVKVDTPFLDGYGYDDEFDGDFVAKPNMLAIATDMIVAEHLQEVAHQLDTSYSCSYLEFRGSGPGEDEEVGEGVVDTEDMERYGNVVDGMAGVRGGKGGVLSNNASGTPSHKRKVSSDETHHVGGGGGGGRKKVREGAGRQLGSLGGDSSSGSKAPSYLAQTKLTTTCSRSRSRSL